MMINTPSDLAASPTSKDKASGDMRTAEAIRMGAKVKQLREGLGLTQAAFAEKAQVQQGQLSQIESGRRRARLDTITKLAAALNVKPHDLLNT